MLDRLIACGMNLTVTLVIALAAGGSLYLGYWGFTEALNGRPGIGAAVAVGSVVPACITLLLARHKNDLVDR